MTHKNKPKIIAIVGPTASGKTAYAIELAKKLQTEIISADSRLVYKGFDIACAKPKKQEMQGIKHHLMNIVEPEINYSVANFYDDSKKIISDLIQNGKTPIVAGGTGLYFRILLEDFELPRVEANYQLRKELEQKTTEELHRILTELDTITAEKIHYNNKVKIIRAIEVAQSLKKPISQAAGKKEPEFDVEWIGLNYQNRADLYEKINLRVDKMLEEGIVEETKKLLEKHGRINNFINTIGYQEILEYLDGKTTLQEAICLIKQNTRRYAKRQLTWFRRNKEIQWLLY